jgi:hypothetical protein
MLDSFEMHNMLYYIKSSSWKNWTRIMIHHQDDYTKGKRFLDTALMSFLLRIGETWSSTGNLNVTGALDANLDKMGHAALQKPRRHLAISDFYKSYQ